MKKLLLLILFFGILAGIAFGPKLGVTHHAIQEGKKVLSAQTVSEPTIPETISIPKIDVNAHVESVGMDKEGKMDVPKDADNAAWYNLGYKPGQTGNAVIDGHFDKESGAPAVFWNIKKLSKGDKIIITDTEKHTHTFAVVRIEQYPYNDFPLQEVFGASSKPMLNLITCQGEWSSTDKNYSHRMVVYSELVE